MAKVKVSRNPQPKKHGFFVILVDKKASIPGVSRQHFEVRAKSPRPQWIELQGTDFDKKQLEGEEGGKIFRRIVKGITWNHSQRSTQISINLEQFISGIHETNGKSTYMNGWFFMVFM